MSTPPPDPDATLHPSAEGGVSLSAERLSVDGDVVGRDKVTIIQQLTALPGLPTDHATPIQNFLYEYLGLPGQRVPFGGREAELAALDAWLIHEQAPPFALLAAEAGRGKSALLVYWAARLRASGALHVIFIPISLRFGTALASVTFTALAARLGEVYGEPVKWANLEPEQWRGVCQSYLSRTPPDGKPLVAILDGLDEAAGWQAGAGLFPRVLPPGVRLVVSARTLARDGGEQGWRRRLGWEGSDAAHSISLPPLTRAGVGEVLAAMGNPLDRLATRVDVVGELFRLSEGDPLLVRLYVEALLPYGEQAAMLGPESLAMLRPGLAGYFDRWWEDQEAQWEAQKRDPFTERASTAEFFNACAAALGPLPAATLAEVAGGDLASALVQRRIAGDLGRFVIGDGKAQGYSFSHPRLGYHFWEQMTPREQQQWEARFLAHGEQVLDALNRGEMAPAEAPPYAVQTYGAHLERARAPDAAFYALISEGWMRAWEALEGTFAGFLGDVARAWQRADKAMAAGRTPGAALVQQAKAALCHSSIAALSANIPPALLALAVEHGLRTPVQALVLIRQQPTDEQRAQSLVRVAPFLPPALLPQALDTARAIGKEWSRANALQGLAPYLDEAGLRKVLALAREIGDERRYVEVLVGLAPHLDEEGLREVLVAAREIGKGRWGAAALAELASHLSEEKVRREVITEALAAARAIGDEGIRAAALTEMVPHLSEEGVRREVITEALAAARAIGDKGIRAAARAGLAPHLSEEDVREALEAARKLESRVAALRVLASHLGEEGMRREVIAEALAAARVIEDQGSRAAALTELVPHLGEEGVRRKVIIEALAAARAIRDERRRSEVLRGLAPHLSEEGLREALAAARAIGNGGRCAEALAGLAPYLSEKGMRGDAITEALAAARGIEDVGRRVLALTGLAPHLSERGLGEALAAVRAVGDREWRATALVRLAPYLSEEGVREALAVARGIGFEWSRAAALVQLAPYLSDEGMREALAVAWGIGDVGRRVEALMGLAPHLSEEGMRREVITEALAAARGIGDEGRRVEALTGLVPYLSEEGMRREVITEALAVARGIGDEGRRVAALTGLVPHLSEEGMRHEVITEALAAARGFWDERWRAGALAGLAPYLSETGLREALAAAQAAGDGEWRAAALVRLAPHLSEGVLQEALAAARAIGDGKWRAVALSGLAPHLSGAVQRQVLLEALTAIWANEHKWMGGKELSALVPLLVEWVARDRPEMLRLWGETLHALARYPRPDFLDDLAALLPFALALAGDEKEQAADGIMHAILEVCSWWP